MTLYKNFSLLKAEMYKKSIYDEARNEVIKTFKSLEGLHAIYEFGKLNVPGISDLDLIIVFKDSLKSKDIGRQFEDCKLPEWVDKLLCGSTIMIFSESDFKSILVWDDLIVHKIYGEHVELLPIGHNEEYRTVAQVMDWLPERLLSLKRFSYMKEIPAIRFLGILHSLNYSLKRVLDLEIIPEGQIPHFQEHFIAVQSLRKNYFELSDEIVKEQFLVLHNSAAKLAALAIENTNYWLSNSKSYYKTENNSSGRFMISEKEGFIIDDNVDTRKEIINCSKDLNLVGVSNNWGLHWQFYASGDGLIQKNMNNSLFGISTKGHIEKGLKVFLNTRIQHCNSMAVFLRKNSFRKGLYKFGWFYN